MSNFCEICGKGPRAGKNVSHSHRKSPRRFEANIQKVRIVKDGTTKSAKVCTSCIKAGKVVKA